MPATTEHGNGDLAYRLIRHYRSDVHENFTLDPLKEEFPSLAQTLAMSDIRIARTDANDAGAFKWRGALVGAKHLKEEGAEALVVPSAGNHARGAVLAAKILGMGIHVVVPETAPPPKNEGLRQLWDDPLFTLHTVGRSFDEALEWANDHTHLGALLHPYDNPHVAAGQGTVLDDILQQEPTIDHIVLPVGGGGLLAGMIGRLHELGRSDIMFHAVEPTGSNSLSRSLASEQITSVEAPNAKYGGTAIKAIGRHAFEICRQNTDILTVYRVTDQEVQQLIYEYRQDRREMQRESTPHFEPTTLVAIAGLTRVAKEHKGSIAVVGTGRNASLDDAL